MARRITSALFTAIWVFNSKQLESVNVSLRYTAILHLRNSEHKCVFYRPRHSYTRVGSGFSNVSHETRVFNGHRSVCLYKVSSSVLTNDEASNDHDCVSPVLAYVLCRISRLSRIVLALQNVSKCV